MRHLSGTCALLCLLGAPYLRQKGWRLGEGCQSGEPNYRLLKDWNVATVYQQSLAIMGAQIDR